MSLPNILELKKVPRKFIAFLLLIAIIIGIAFFLPPRSPLKQNLSRLWQNLTTPKIDYTFHPAEKQTGFALSNENKTAGFKVLLGNTRAPNSPEARFEMEKTWLEFAPSQNFGKTPFKKEAKNGKDTITWENFLESTDASYQMVDDGLKESVIIKNAIPAEKSMQNKEPLSLSFDITTFGVIARSNIYGKPTPIFLDKNSRQYRFHLEKPYLLDAKGIRFDALEYELIPLQSTSMRSDLRGGPTSQGLLAKIIPAVYALTVGTGDRYTLRLTLPRDWLTDPARAYPVILDPTVTHNTQTAFATGTLNRVKDEGSADASPLLTSMYHELPADINTVGLWHMNEGSGTTTADASGNSYTGTLSGSTLPSWNTAANSKLGNSSLSFNGSTAYVAVNSVNPFRSNFTVEVWVNFSAVNKGSDNVIIANGSAAIDNGLHIVERSGKAYFGFYGDDCAGNTAFSTNTWYHLAYVYDSGKKIYVNGVLDNSCTSNAYASTATNTDIGLNPWSTAYFNGTMDEFRISNIARTPEEIKQDAQRFPYAVYTSPVIDITSGTSILTGWTNLTWLAKGVNTGAGETPISTTNLVAQWNFNETSGTTAASGGSCSTTCNGTLTTFSNTTGQDVAAGSGWTAANARWGTGALMFNGSSNYVTALDTTLPSGASAQSIGGWFKTSASFATNTYEVFYFDGTKTTSQAIYFGVGNDANVPANNLFVGPHGYATVSNRPVNDGQWHYAVATFDGTTWYLYLDGALVSSKAMTTNIVKTGTVYIGNSNAANYWNGALDNVTVYNRTLSAAEILANYQAGNIEFQTRTSADNSTWEAWKPVTGETAIDSMDGPYQYNTTDTGLVSYWPMDETSGATANDRKSTNNGTATGTTIVDGKFGKARSFNGSTDYVSGTDTGLPSGNNALSIEAWIKPSALGGWIVNYGTYSATNDVEFATNATYGLVLSFWGSSCDVLPAGISLTTGVWQHVAVTKAASSNSINFYVNGQLKATATPTSCTPNIILNNLTIGSVHNGGGSFFNGSIDEVRIYNTAISAATIYQHWIEGIDNLGTGSGRIGVSTDAVNKMEGSASEKLTLGAPQVDSNTIGLWHMEETSGTGAYIKDSSVSVSVNTGTGADGTCTVSSGTTNINTSSCAGRGTADAVNFSVTANTASGQNQITLSSTPTGLAVNDEVLIINLQGTSGSNTTVGQYETKTITAISTNTLTLDSNLSNGYDGTTQKIMVQRIPNYTNVTISGTLTVSAWNGTKGGILVFRANGTVTVNSGGTIQTNGLGYRGGTGVSTDNSTANQGENKSGTGSASNSQSNGGGGGGSAGSGCCGRGTGGGGGHGTAGSAGTTTSPGTAGNAGSAVGTTSLSNDLELGPGGGGGAIDTFLADTGDAGGVGGGTIFIATQTITVSGSITANGAIGPGTGSQPACGGDGGGGSILLQASSVTLGSSLVTATGATGTCNVNGVAGGNGGNGIIRVESNNTISGTTNPVASTLAPNNGTPTGTTVVNGFYGKARSLNGTSDYVTVPNASSLNITGSITLEAWVKTSSANDYSKIAYKVSTGAPWNGYEFGMHTGGAVRADFYNAAGSYITPTNSKNIKDGQWHYIAATYDGTTANIYVDGVVGTPASGTGYLSTNTNSLFIGADTVNATRYFNGSIDGVRISNVARTAEEIAEAYRAGRDHRISKTIVSTDLSAKTKLPFYVAADRPGRYLEATIGNNAYVNYEPDVNTVGLWHLEEQTGSGAYIKDSSGYGNNGTPTGTTFVQGNIGKARSLNGTSDVIISSNNVGITGAAARTLSFWAKTNSTVNQGMVGWGTASAGNWFIAIIYNTHWYFNGYAADWDTGITPDTTNWHYHTLTYDGTKVAWYIDGALLGTSTIALNTTASVLNIGRRIGTNDMYFNGTIDEVRVDNTARSAADIRAAYEIGRRTHPINIDFVTSPQAAYSSGTSVTINNPYGTTALTNTLSVGDTLIFKENVNGTETVGQAAVTAITNTSTTYGTVTVASAPTFPSGGYSTNAKVFKWQREYFDLTGSLTTQRNGITRITLRDTDGSQGANVWLDDFRYNTNYINSQTPTSFDTTTGIGTYSNTGITSTLNRYLQYRAILSSWDTPVSSQLTSVAINYTINNPPSAPTISAPANGATNVSLLPAISLAATDPDSDYVRYKIQLCTDAAFTLNCQTFDQTASQTGWSGQNTQTNTAYTSGTTGTYTVQSALSEQTVYYIRAYAIDPGGSNTWSSVSATTSFTTTCNSIRGLSTCRMRLQGIQLQGIQIK